MTKSRTGAPLTVVVLALVLAACGSDASGGGEPGEAAGASAPAVSAQGLAPALAANVRERGKLVGEGREEFDRRLAKLRGHPVVVNQWASWCPSCRAEFPFFREAAVRYRKQVAFLALDSQDQTGNAQEFLREFPWGIPSVEDPDASVAAAYGGGQAWPTTIFFDAQGEVAHVKLGGYTTAEMLDADIRRYALDDL